ncbi:puromycin-sensitive aminopeptidase-like [Styela clava]
MATKKPFSRLPTNVLPINYNLWLKPCIEEFTFDGKVDIEVDVKEPTAEVVMNSMDIKISSVTYCQKDMKIFESSAIEFDESQEKVIIKFASTLAQGSGVLSILFKGELNDKMKGFYRSRYMVDGEARYGAVTQFEATDARRSFPCWDEPALKATFDVTLVVPKDRVALSNMNVISEADYFEKEFKVVKYARTPIMSTYLLAFVVGEFDFVEGKTPKGLPVRVYTPLGKKKQGQFALDVAVKALPYYEDYFNIPYPLPKMDLIAIADFCAGAMENWGLVTYRESALLIDEDNSSAHARQWVSLVVCHELAHQWFGNLVTMEWWTHLWLNEGFASFMEYLATDHCHPKFDIWTQFVSHDYMRGIDLDALDNSHPIEVPVGHPEEIDEIFDAISYSKGASVIRMLHNWIGDENFRKGMHNYLKQHAYKNAFTEDLWDALGDASGKPVRDVMGSWTRQMGFPVVSVTVKSRTDNSVTLKLSQKKFYANQKTIKDGKSPMWSIPISFSTYESPSKPVKDVLLKDETMEVTLENVAKTSWIKANPGTYGFYRVQYSHELLELLLPAIKDKSLPERDRLGFENDMFALAASGIAPTTDFLDALSAYENETNYSVWCDLDANIGSLSVLLWNDEDALNKFKKYILSLYDSTNTTLGWDPQSGEGHLTAMLRSLMIRRVGRFGCEKTIAEANKRFENHLNQKSSIVADLRSPVYSTIVSHGGPGELDKLLELHEKVDLHEEKERIERSVGSVKKPELITKVLDFAMTDKVRSNDKVFMIGSAAISNPIGRDITWEFVKKNWEKLHDMFKGSFLINRLVQMTTENYSSEQKAAEIKDFFEKNPPIGAERKVQQSLENIRRRLDWWKRDGKSISEWLSAKSE